MATVLTLTILLIPPASAGSYRFTNVADSRQFQDFGGYPPGLNDSGTAVFRANRGWGRGGGIFTGSGVTITTVVDDTSASLYQEFGARPWINNSGDIAFRATLRNHGAGIFLAHSGSVTTLVDTWSSTSFFYNVTLDEPSLNNTGAVAFHAFNNSTYRNAIYRVENGSVTTIADWGDWPPPAIASSGEVVFEGQNGIYRGSGGDVATVAECGPGGFSSLYSPSISDSGRVLFEGMSGDVPPFDQVRGLYDGPDLVANRIIDTSGPFYGFEQPFLNGIGQIAFAGTLDDRRRGLFTGTDPVADRVILTGDELFGATLTDLSFYRGFNNNGQVAFVYQLSDGRTGIAIATPVSAIPRPVITSITASFLTGDLVVSGTNGPPQAPYWVLASTDVALRLTNWARLATNLFDPAGNFAFTNTLGSNRPQCFYMLQMP